jgi:hypothetical protein
MSYDGGYSTYDYGPESDSDDDLPPPPPPPPARYGYTIDSGAAGYTPPRQYGYTQASQLPSSLQPGGGGSRYNTPPPGASSYRASPPPSTYNSPPGTYQSPPASTYRESTPPNFRGSTPPAYGQSPTNNHGQSPRSYSQVPPPPPPPPGAYRGGAPVSGAYRSPPPSAPGSQPPSAYRGSPQPYEPSSLKRVESYSEDYSAYGISTRPQTGRFNTEDMSDRVSGQNAQDLETPPVFDRRQTEQMALAISRNVKRDEDSMSAKFGASAGFFLTRY